MHIDRLISERFGISIRSVLILFVGVSLLISFKLNSWLIGLLLVALIASKNRSGIPINFKKNIKLIAPFWLYFLIFLISMIYTDNKVEGWKDLESKLGLLLIPFVIFSQSQLKRSEIAFILKGFAIFTLSMGLLAIGLSLKEYGKVATNWELSAVIGVHASYLALYSILGIAVFLHYAMESRRWVKWFFFLLAFVQFLLLLLIASRIILLSFIGISGLWVFIIRFSIQRLILFLSILGSMALSYYMVDGVRERFQEAINFNDKIELDVSEEATLGKIYGGRALRIAIWTCSVDVVEEHWAFGVGNGDVHEHLQQSYKDHDFTWAWKYNNFNSHNLLIETIIAVGVPGILFLMLIFFNLIRKASSSLNMVIITFCFSFSMLSMMEASFNVQKGLIFFLIFGTSLMHADLKESKF